MSLYQDYDPDESNVNEEFVEVGEDVPLEGGDGGQEAAGKVYIERFVPVQELVSHLSKSSFFKRFFPKKLLLR